MPKWVRIDEVERPSIFEWRLGRARTMAKYYPNLAHWAFQLAELERGKSFSVRGGRVPREIREELGLEDNVLYQVAADGSFVIERRLSGHS